MNRLVVGAASAAVAALAVGALGFGGSPEKNRSQVADPSFGMTAADLRDVADEEPGAPLVLPVRLPADYGWAGISRHEGDGQAVWARVSQFTSVRGRPVVELCAQAPGPTEGCERDDDPGITRQWEDLMVHISFDAGSGQHVGQDVTEFWQQVELTTKYSELTWTK